MTLPASRNTTYSAGSPILSNDLNALQDCIIGRKHGAITVAIHGTRLHAVTGSNQTNQQRTSAGVSQTGGTLPGWCVGVELPIGTRILAVRAYFRDSATGTTTLNVALKKYVAVTPTATTVATSANSLGNGTYQAATTGAVSETLVAGTNYEIEVNPGGGGTGSCTVHFIEIDIDLP